MKLPYPQMIANEEFKNAIKFSGATKAEVFQSRISKSITCDLQVLICDIQINLSQSLLRIVTYSKPSQRMCDRGKHICDLQQFAAENLWYAILNYICELIWIVGVLFALINCIRNRKSYLRIANYVVVSQVLRLDYKDPFLWSIEWFVDRKLANVYCIFPEWFVTTYFL